MEIEDIFCSRLRMRILKIIAQVGELNVSEIARKLGVNYATTNKHLRTLEDEDIIQHKKFGRIRIYRFNQNSVKAKAILDLLELWEQNK
jgi:predicted transcriptional regulator